MLNSHIEFYSKKYKLEENENFIVSTFLNPRYKKFSKANGVKKEEFSKIAEEAIKKNYKDFINNNNREPELIEKCNNDKERTRLSDSSDEENNTNITWRIVKKEISSYMMEPKHSNALEFWEENKKKYPILFEFFKKYASVPATSTPSERVFSEAGYQVCINA